MKKGKNLIQLIGGNGPEVALRCEWMVVVLPETHIKPSLP
jgi:hypothetical protein